MANLKALLGDKYKDGMSIEDLLKLDVLVPEPDMTNFVSKDKLDKATAEAAEYKKQLRATMSEQERKAQEEAERIALLQAENDKLKAEKAIAESAKELVAIGYDSKLAADTAKALYSGDSAAVIKAQAQFVEAQVKAAIAESVKSMPTPPGGGNSSTLTKEQFKKMSIAEQVDVYNKTPELYAELTK